MRARRGGRLFTMALAWVLIAASVVAIVVGVGVPIGVPTASAAVPGGFGDGVVASGLTLPTGMEFMPDGRILVTEKSGVVRVVQNGAVLPTPLIDLSSRVSSYWDRGLLGIAVDPEFTTTRPFVYLLYPYDPTGSDDSGIKSLRLSRFTVTGNTASMASEVVILGSLPSPGCTANLGSPDCVPNDWYGHGPGSLVFAPDRTLFVSMGDGASWDEVDPRALRALDIDQYPGKILRIDRDGNGVASNPFWNGNARSIRSRVFATGLRNPFRFALRPGTSTLHVGDVGWLTREELNIVSAGDNLGWPCYEGPNQQPGYASFSVCQALYARGVGAVRRAAVDWTSIGGAAAIGGPSASLTNFPSPWNRGVFFGDYANGWIRYLPLDAAGNVSGSPVDFATALDSPVDLKVGPDGALYYVSIMAGQVRRIAVGADPPTPPPFGVSFLSDLTPFGTPVNGFGPYERDRSNGSSPAGDGVPIGIGGVPFTKGLGVHAASEVRYALDKPCRLQATIGVDDEVGNTGSVIFEVWNGTSTRLYTSGIRTGSDAGVAIDVALTGVSQARLVVTDAGNGNVDDHASWGGARFVCGTQGAPVPTIATPTADDRLDVGQVVSFTGSATDPEDGVIPAGRLAWQVTVHHCPSGNCHTHFLTSATGAAGSFVLPDHGDDTYLTLDLTATDAVGLSTTVSRRLEYRTSQLRLDTVPSGRTILYDGNPVQTPFAADVPVGAVRTVSIGAVQDGARFLGWSDGGALQHDITVGADDTLLAAAFSDAVMIPVTPNRLVDTREGLGGEILVPGVNRRVVVAGRGGVPATGASAVVLNVTITESRGSGFATVWPGGSRPIASNLNFTAGSTVPNLVTVGLGADGGVDVFSSQWAHAVIDVVGWYASGFVPTQPARLADTREGSGGVILLAGETREIDVAGRGGVPPSGATAVALNVTAVGAWGPGYLTVWPSGAARPVASNLNFATGQTIANAVVVGVGANGRISVYNSSAASNIVVDVAGWYRAGFVPVVPARVMDTRAGLGGIVLGPQETRRLQVVGVGGVPAFGVDAVAANITVTDPTSAGFVTAWPSGRRRPLASSLNFVPGQTVPNAAIIGVGPGGTIELYNSSGSSHLVVDITGWFASTAQGPTNG